MRDGFVKKAGASLLLAGLVTVFAGFLGVGYAGATVNPDWTAGNNAFLKASQRGSSNPGFTKDTCPTPPEGMEGWWGWHFVLQGSTTNFDTVDVDFQNYGFHALVDFVSDPTPKHAYVWTPTADTLLDAQAHVSGTGTLDTEFVLSHVCAGTNTQSSSSSESSSVESSSESTPPQSSSESTPPESSSESTPPQSSSESTPPESSSESSSVESSSESSSVESSSESSSVESSSESSSVLSSSDTQSSSSVLGSETSRSSAAGPTVLGEDITRAAPLARTGFDPSALLTIGLAAALSGAVILVASDRMAHRG